MVHLIDALVQFIAAHAAWTFPIMFLAAFGESFVFVSLLFPGTTIMIAAGLLVPDGTIPLVPLLAGGIAGAVIGDGISWWLGRRYGHLITGRWPLGRHPEFLARGEALFFRFGALSVFVGRFFGPLRAVVPLLAGILGMRSLPFWVSNLLSALIWAPALVLPGSAAAWAARIFDVPPQWRLPVAAGALLVLVALGWAIGRIAWLRELRRAPGD